eukprot:2612656-Rhodomonas_salina.1
MRGVSSTSQHRTADSVPGTYVYHTWRQYELAPYCRFSTRSLLPHTPVQEGRTEGEILSEYVELVNLAALTEVIEDARR